MASPIIAGRGGNFTQFQSVGQNQQLSDYSPETQAELARSERRRQIANLLMQQGMGGGPSATQAGRFIVPKGWAQNVGDLAKVAAGMYGNYKADQSGKEAIKGENEQYAQAIKDYQQRVAGTPGTPAVPGELAIGTNEDDNAMVGGSPAIHAQPASRDTKQQAILDAMQSRIPAVQRYMAMQQGALDAGTAREDAYKEQRLKEEFQAREHALTRDQRREDTQERIDQKDREIKAKIEEQARHSQMMEKLTGDQNERNDEIARHNKAMEDIERNKVGMGKAIPATAQKELFEADDVINAAQNAKSALTQALAINDKAYSGVGAGLRSAIVSNIPGAPKEGANAAVDLDNIVTSQALEQLKLTFGGMPTEGERKILIDVQGSINKTAEQRAEIWKRAITFIDRREKLMKERADQLRGGTYFKPQGGATVPPVDLSNPTQPQRRSADKTRMKFDAQGNPVQ